MQFFIANAEIKFIIRIYYYIVFKNYSLPQRIDNSIKIHLRDLIGGTRSFSAKMQNFVVDEKTMPTWKPKDLRQYATVWAIAEGSPTKLHGNTQNLKEYMVIIRYQMIQIYYRKKTGMEKQNLYFYIIKMKK